MNWSGNNNGKIEPETWDLIDRMLCAGETGEPLDAFKGRLTKLLDHLPSDGRPVTQRTVNTIMILVNIITLLADTAVAASGTEYSREVAIAIAVDAARG